MPIQNKKAGGTPKKREPIVPPDAPTTTDSLIDKSLVSTGNSLGVPNISDTSDINRSPKKNPDGTGESAGYSLTGDTDTDLENIAAHYKTSDLDDSTWRGVWKTIFEGESTSNLNEGESKYGRLPKGQRAVGGMQVIPKTARGLGFTDEELKDPIYRFMAGVKNLREEYNTLKKDKRITSQEHLLSLTFAAYHAGRPNVLKSLDAGEDGVPDVDDGLVNTRDYTFKKVEALRAFLGGAQERAISPQSQEEQMTFDLSQPSPTDVKSESFTGVKGENLPSWKHQPTNFDEFLSEQDRQMREDLGLITPENYPNNITSKPVQYSFELQPGEKLTPDRIVDELVTQLTGDAGAHEKFKLATGHSVLNIFREEADAWLQQELDQGTIQISENVTPQGARTIVKGATPVQSLIIRQLNAFAKGGKEAVDKENAIMLQEIATEERRAAESKYGKLISDLNNRADEAEQQYLDKLSTEDREKIQPEEMMNDLSPEGKRLRTEAGVLQSELEKRFPTTRSEEIWKGIKRMTAGVFTSYRGLFRNVKEIGEAVLYTNDKEYAKEGVKRDKQYRDTIASLQKSTPETRRLIGGLVETIGSAVTFDAPVYMAGGAVFGPAGIIYTTALRSADKPINEFAKDIATALLEIPISKAIGGAITKGGYAFGKQELGEKVVGRIASEGGGESLSEMSLDYIEGKKLDWMKAIHNFAAGAGFGISGGAKSKEGVSDAERQITPQTEMFKVMSPVGVATGADGQNRYQAVIKVGDDIGLVEIPNKHPILVKYAAQAEAGGVPFLTFTEDQFDQALTDFQGTGKAKLPTMTAEQTKEYLSGAKKDEKPQPDRADESISESIGREGKQQETQVQEVVPKEGAQQQAEEAVQTGVLNTVLTPEIGGSAQALQGMSKAEQKQAEREAVLSESEQAQLETAYDKLGTTNEKEIRNILYQSNRRFVKKIQGTSEQDFAQQSYDKLASLTTEEQQVISKVIEANFVAPSKTPTIPGETSDYSASIQGMTDKEFESQPQLVANERELSKFLEEAKEGKVITAETAEEKVQAEQATKDFEKEQKSIKEGEKQVKVGRIPITLPKGLAAQWDQADLDFESAEKKIKSSTLPLDEKKRQIRRLSDQRKKKRDFIVDEYRRLETEQIKRGYLRDSDRPVAILEENDDLLTIQVAGESITREVPRSAVETRKERALKKTKKAKLPTGIRMKVGLGGFSELKQESHRDQGVVYINDNARSAIEDALGVEVDRGFTIPSKNIPDTAKKLRAKGLKRVATQIENAAEERSGAAIIPISDEKAAKTRFHEQVHTVAYDKRLSEDALRRLYRDGSAVRKLLEDLQSSKDKVISEEFTDMNPYDFVQEVIAYGATGDFDSLGVNADLLYDALIEVMSEYSNAFPNEELTVIADNALINFDAIMKEASRRSDAQESKQTTSKEKTGKRVKDDQERGQGRSEKVSEGRDILRVAERSERRETRTEKLIAGIRRLRNDKGPVLIETLRDEFPELRLEKFHEVLKTLVDQKRVFAHKIDNANQLNQKEKEKLLNIDGDYFNAVTITEVEEQFLRKVDRRTDEKKSQMEKDASTMVIATTSPRFRNRITQPIDNLVDFTTNSIQEPSKDLVKPELKTEEDKKENTLQEIIRKNTGDVTVKDAKKVITDGRFAVMTGGDIKKTAALQRELNSMGYKSYPAGDGLFVILNSQADIANMLRLGARYKRENVLIGDSGSYRSPFTRNTPLGRLGQENYSKENKVEFDSTTGVRIKLPNGVVSFNVEDVFRSKRKQNEVEKRLVREMGDAYKKSFKNRAKGTSVDLHSFLVKQEVNIDPITKQKKAFLSNDIVAKFLDETSEDLFGPPPNSSKMKVDEYNAVRARRAQRDGLAVVTKALSGRGDRKDDIQTGLSWYAEAIRKMHELTGHAFPEILSQPQLRVLFDVTLAMSSQGNKVKDNYQHAVNLWRRVIEEFELGRDGTNKLFPTKLKESRVYYDRGKHKERIAENYGRFGAQLEKFNFLTRGYVPVKNQTELSRYKKQGAELEKTEEFEKVNGAQQWYVKDPELVDSIKKYGHIGGVFEYLLTPLSGEADPYRATDILGPKIGAFFLNIAGFSQLVTVDMWASRWFYRVNGGLLNPAEQKGIQDDPASKEDGNIIRGVMQGIANEYNKHHENKITPADVQALLWYAEKDIWSLAGAKDSGTIDFATAAEKILTPEIVADIGGNSEIRDKVIQNFQLSSPQGDRIDVVGTDAAKQESANFFVRQMALPARIGLSATSRKQIMNRKLLTYDAKEWQRHAEWAKAEPLTAAETSDLYNLLQQGFRATNKQEHDKAIEDLQTFVDEVSSMNIFEFLLTARRAGMLSGIKTAGRNSISNLAHLVAEELKRGASAPLDMVLALMSTDKDRTTQGISPRGIWNAIKSLPAGGKAFIDTMVKGNTGATYETFNLGYDPHVTPSWMTGGKAGARILNATVGNFAKYVFRFQAAQDAVFRTYAYSRALYEVAWLEQKNGGRKIADVLANPTVAQSDMAWRAAEFAVFQNDNIINTGYQRWKGNRSEIIKYVLDYELPFIKTGSNIFLQTMDYLVIGSAVKASTALSKETLRDIGKGDWAKLKQNLWNSIDDAETRATIAEAFGRGLVGLGLSYIGYKLAAAGLLYGFGDEDEKERQRRIAQGAGAGHLKLGDHWIDIRAISPIGTLMLAGASAYRAQTKELTGENTKADAFLRLFSTMVSEGLPMARVADEFLNPKQAQSYARRLIGAGSLVPAIVAETAAIQDDVQRDQKGEGLGDSIKREIQGRLPKTPINPNFNRQQLPPKTDVFGRGLQQPFGMDPLATKRDTGNKVTQEASAIGWSMTPPKRDAKKNESVAAFQERKTKTQELMDKVFQDLVSDPEYPSKATKEERKEIFDDSAALARRAVKTGEKVSADELQEIVDLVLDKWKERIKIQNDPKLSDEQKKKLKGKVSSRYSKFIKGALADDDN